jgi:hypothetical protein
LVAVFSREILGQSPLQHKDNTLTPLVVETLGTIDVETGPKLLKHRCRESLGEDVGELRSGRDMENPHTLDGEPLANEVEVELNMLRALMLNGGGGEIHGANVVTIYKGAPQQWNMQLLEQLMKPQCLNNAISHSTVLVLVAGVGDDWLPLQGPGDEVVAKEHGESESGPACVGIATPASIGVDDKVGGHGPMKNKDEDGGASEVTQDPLHSGEMWLLWCVHMEAHLVDSIGDVRACEDEVLQGPSETPIAGQISHQRANVGGDLALSVHWGRARLAVGHASTLKDVDGVLALVEEQVVGPTLDGDPWEVVQLTRSFMANSC